MKKTRGDRCSSEKPTGTVENKNKTSGDGSIDASRRIQDIDDDDYGFGGWLRSPEGVDTLRLFVVGNSIVIFTTVAWPGMQAAYGLLQDWLSGKESFE